MSEEATLSGIHKELGIRVWGGRTEMIENPLIDQNTLETRDRWTEQRELFRRMLEAKKNRFEQDTGDAVRFLSIVGHHGQSELMLWSIFDEGQDVRDELRRLFQIQKCEELKVFLNDDGEIQINGKMQRGEAFVGFPVMITKEAYYEWERRDDKCRLYLFFMKEGIRFGSESVSELDDFTSCFMNGEKLRGIGQYW